MLESRQQQDRIGHFLDLSVERREETEACAVLRSWPETAGRLEKRISHYQYEQLLLHSLDFHSKDLVIQPS